jgi:hypothetical protein
MALDPLSDIHPNAEKIRRAVLDDDPDRVSNELSNGGQLSAVVAMMPIAADGVNTLHFAAANGVFTVVQLCCDISGIDINCPAPGNGWTPMHFAAYNGHERICATLKYHDADAERVDHYGETACDVAAAADHQAAVDVLGGNAAAREARRRMEEDRERLIAEARAFQEERERAAQQAKDEEERKRVAEERRKDRIRRAKELRAQLESARLDQIRRWMLSRETVERDVWNNLEYLYASQLLMASDLIAAEIQQAHIAVEPQPAASPVPATPAPADSTSPTGGRGKKKAGGKRSKRAESSAASGTAQSPARAKSPSTVAVEDSVLVPTRSPTTDTPAGGVISRSWASLEEDLASDPDLQLPVVAGVITKEKKKELSRAKLRIDKVKRERRRAHQQAVDAFEATCRGQLEAVETEETLLRQLLEVDWVLGAARIRQLDAFADRRHKGDYIFHSAEPKCNCGLPSCRIGACTWSCCGERVCDAVGCVVVDDQSKPPYHPGAFTFHMDGCQCSQVAVAVGRTREAVRTLVELRQADRGLPLSGDDDDDDAGGDGSDRSSQSDRDEDAARASASFMGGESSSRLAQSAVFNSSRAATRHARQSFDGSSRRRKHTRFCNPGGTVWSCCGAVDPDSEGCVMWTRFLYQRNVLVQPRFELATTYAGRRLPPAQLKKAARKSAQSVGGCTTLLDASLDKFCRVRIEGDFQSRVEHVIDAPTPNTSTRCTVIGALHSAVDIAATTAVGPIDARRIMCFEVVVLAAPEPESHSAERLVIGFVRDDCYVGPGTTIGGDIGVGWWSHSTEIRGLGCNVNSTEPFRANDVVCLALDHLNREFYAFKNRKLVAQGPFTAPCRLVPAVTLVAGSRVRVDESRQRAMSGCVDEYMDDRHKSDLSRRLYGSAEKFRSIFRDKFELEHRRLAKAERIQQGLVDPDESEDEGFIDFDV